MRRHLCRCKFVRRCAAHPSHGMACVRRYQCPSIRDALPLRSAANGGVGVLFYGKVDNDTHRIHPVDDGAHHRADRAGHARHRLTIGV